MSATYPSLSSALPPTIIIIIDMIANNGNSQDSASVQQTERSAPVAGRTNTTQVGNAVSAGLSTANIPPLSKYKLVFLGDQSVGKTAIIQRFIFSTFDSTYQATIGIDFLSRSLVLEDRTVRLQLWDTAGQERFRSLIPSYIRDSSVAVIVYDITNRASFLNTSKWIEDVRVERAENVVVMLVGNKSDLGDKRQVSTDEGQEKARQEGALFIETSAKTSTNVKTLFRRLAMSLPGLEDTAVGDDAGLIDVELNPTPPKPVAAESQCGC